MGRLIDFVRALRPGALVFSLPYALLWARALRDPPGLTGWLIIALHSAGMLFALNLLTRARARSGGSPPLLADRGAPRASARAFEVTTPALLLACVVLLIALTPAAVRVSLAGVILLAVAAWHSARPWKTKWLGFEAAAPFIALVAPALLLGQSGWSGAVAPAAPPPEAMSPTPGTMDAALAAAHPGAGMSAAVLGATLLGAVCMGAFILLCFARDAAWDERSGERTTATRLGRAGARRMLHAWVAAACLLASMGAAWGWWAWAAPTVAAIGAMWIAGALATNRLDDATRRWWWVALAMGLVLFMTTTIRAA